MTTADEIADPPRPQRRLLRPQRDLLHRRPRRQAAVPRLLDRRARRALDLRGDGYLLLHGEPADGRAQLDGLRRRAEVGPRAAGRDPRCDPAGARHAHPMDVLRTAVSALCRDRSGDETTSRTTQTLAQGHAAHLAGADASSWRTTRSARAAIRSSRTRVALARRELPLHARRRTNRATDDGRAHGQGLHPPRRARLQRLVVHRACRDGHAGGPARARSPPRSRRFPAPRTAARRRT